MNTVATKCHNGDRVRDKVTRFTGIAVSRIERLGESPRIQIQEENARPENCRTMEVTESRCVVVQAGAFDELDGQPGPQEMRVIGDADLRSTELGSLGNTNALETNPGDQSTRRRTGAGRANGRATNGRAARQGGMRQAA